jgi:hypothetical protein
MNGRALMEAATAASLKVTAAAAQGTSAASHLGLTEQPVALPGAGRVILVFLLISALAVGVAWALRRFSPGLLGRMQPQGDRGITVHARQPLERGATLYIVSFAGERMAVLTTRSGVALQALNDRSDATAVADSVGRRN